MATHAPGAAPGSAIPPDPNQPELDAMKQEAIKDMANAALLVRDAVMAALPVAPEQYVTISIPGTIIDTDDIAKGGTFVYDVDTEPFTPTAVRQAEAKLVDYMTPLANVMIGNTGKSVSRSYSAALDYLVPKKATISSSNNNVRSPGDASYDGAMKYLTQKDANTGFTPVEAYIQKQTAWAKAQDDWDTAKIQAKNDSEKAYPKDNTKAVQAFNDWAQSHFRRFETETQARWMDWVTNGDKYNVEYNFGLVDVDSIMARIENSKQSMRNSTIIDADGANELQEVNLTPKKWAFLCQQKANAAASKGPTLDQYNAEIQRLQIFLVSLNALQAELKKSPPLYPKAGTSATPPDTTAASTALTAAYTKLYEAQGQANGGVTNPPPDVDGARNGVAKALADWESVAQDLVKWKLSQPGGAEWLVTTIKTVNDQINALQDALAKKTGARTDLIGAIVSVHTSDQKTKQGSGNDLAQPGSEFANPIFGLNQPPGQTGPAPADPWTKITASFSASDQKTLYTESSWGFSVGGGATFGLFSAGGAYSHDESTKDFRGDMTSCDVSISFSAMVVNIDRPWLYAELFNDFEIDIAADAKLSPGPEDLHTMMEKQRADPTYITSLQMYNVFPSFPTSFIVGADTVLEFTGNTKHIEQHFHSVSNSASASFGWGPFSVSASYHSSSMSQSFQMETTATGCKISFAAPQIIAWVSQILPALPRKPNFEPLLQTEVPTK